MTKNMLVNIATFLALANIPTSAFALDGVLLKSPSGLKFVIDSNRVYLRNLETFNSE